MDMDKHRRHLMRIDYCLIFLNSYCQLLTLGSSESAKCSITLNQGSIASKKSEIISLALSRNMQTLLHYICARFGWQELFFVSKNFVLFKAMIILFSILCQAYFNLL